MKKPRPFHRCLHDVPVLSSHGYRLQSQLVRLRVIIRCNRFSVRKAQMYKFWVWNHVGRAGVLTTLKYYSPLQIRVMLLKSTVKPCGFRYGDSTFIIQQ
jgi:hypothetical protein